MDIRSGDVIVDITSRDVGPGVFGYPLADIAFDVGDIAKFNCAETAAEREGTLPTHPTQWNCGLQVAAGMVGEYDDTCRVVYACGHEDCPLVALKAANWFVEAIQKTKPNEPAKPHPIAAA